MSIFDNLKPSIESIPVEVKDLQFMYGMPELSILQKLCVEKDDVVTLNFLKRGGLTVSELNNANDQRLEVRKLVIEEKTLKQSLASFSGVELQELDGKPPLALSLELTSAELMPEGTKKEITDRTNTIDSIQSRIDTRASEVKRLLAGKQGEIEFLGERINEVYNTYATEMATHLMGTRLMRPDGDNGDLVLNSESNEPITFTDELLKSLSSDLRTRIMKFVSSETNAELETEEVSPENEKN